MAFYKYYAGVTSQIGFCATPLRLDSYSRCQFSCDYCFASTRQGFGRNERFKVSNPASLKQRMERVQNGEVNSALDEFISNRIPFQLGGMSDPFTQLEATMKTTLAYLKILKSYNYPVIVSTKNDLIANDEYLDEITDSNIYVRFSTTVVDKNLRNKVDKGCPSMERIARASQLLNERKIPVSYRFQPIIPGQEENYKYLLDIAESSGVKHISAEYLKSPIDANRKFGKELVKILDGNPISFFRKYGAKKQGREYIMPLSYRREHLVDMAINVRQRGITFGFADNDLLLHSDGSSCCGASDLYLKDANFFSANIIALAKRKSLNDTFLFRDYLSSWIPENAISTYLNSKARIKMKDKGGPDWFHYLKEMWEGRQGVYMPSYFDGIESTSGVDNEGLSIYLRKKSNFEKYYDEKYLYAQINNQIPMRCTTV